jgi:hypothetical protein
MRNWAIRGPFVFFASEAVAAGVMDDAATWWRTLGEDDRLTLQADLVLTGHYDGFVDATFGRATFNAVQKYQRSLGTSDPDGSLSASEIRTLHDAGERAFAELGMTLEVVDEGVAAYVPRAFLTRSQRELEGGTTFLTADSDASLYLMGWDFSASEFVRLTRDLLARSNAGTVSYKSIHETFVVVSGRSNGSEYYSLLSTDRKKIVGLDVIWTDQYADLGGLAATFAASYSGSAEAFVTRPTPAPGTGDELPRTDQVADPSVRRLADTADSRGTQALSSSGEQIGAFFVPSDSLDVIFLNDEIRPGATLEFRRALRAQPAAKILLLASPGGSVNEGLLVAHQVADLRLATEVPKGAACYSACAYIFFAGKPRTVSGELGVHQIYGEGVDAADTQIVLSDVLEALYEFGVPQEVVSAMLRTRPEEMHIFSPSELEKIQTESRRVASASPAPIERDLPGVQFMSSQNEANALRTAVSVLATHSKVLEGLLPRVATANLGAGGLWYHVRVDTHEIDQADRICAAVRAAKGTCLVTGR